MAGPPPIDPFKSIPVGRIEGTRLESVEEIRQAIKARRTGTVKEAVPDPDTVGFRPLRRPPMALLCVLDDGQEEGEWLRLRGDRLVIGRTEGDVRIPHDAMMSSRHAELSRQVEQGRPTWYLTDLQSTNGTYVRVGSSVLKHNQEMLLGSRRYRFDAALHGAEPAEAPPGADARSLKTQGWQGISPADLAPSLVELTAQGEGQRFPLNQPENWVGRDSRCTAVLGNDPLVSPRHARIYRDKKGRWHVENAKSLNGVWLRVDHIALDAACQFQLGEQRFLVRIL